MTGGNGVITNIGQPCEYELTLLVSFRIVFARDVSAVHVDNHVTGGNLGTIRLIHNYVSAKFSCLGRRDEGSREQRYNSEDCKERFAKHEIPPNAASWHSILLRERPVRCIDAEISCS